MIALFRLARLRNVMIRIKIWGYRRAGMEIDPSARMSLSAKLDLSFPRGIHIGGQTYLAFDARVLSHDFTRGLYLHTRIGSRCFIGGRSLILPGISIGDDCIVGAGSVVTRDVPDGSIVAGNPASILKTGIRLQAFGRFDVADETESNLRLTDPTVGALPSVRHKAER